MQMNRSNEQIKLEKTRKTNIAGSSLPIENHYLDEKKT